MPARYGKWTAGVGIVTGKGVIVIAAQDGQKWILSLDGGGVRGVITLAFLERIEQLLASRSVGPERLCDRFDLVGGTSTGAIIATALALGMSATEIKDFYFSWPHGSSRGPGSG